MDTGNKDNIGADLNATFKDSDTRVRFEEYNVPRSDSIGTPKIVRWVIKYSGGLIKNESQVSYVILCFFVVSITIFFLVVFGDESEIPLPSTPGPDYYAIPSQR